MKEVFFTEDGSLKINQTIMSQPSFLKIMEDGIVTALVESNVLNAIFKQYSMQMVTE